MKQRSWEKLSLLWCWELATWKTKEDLEEKYAGKTCKSKLARGASSEQKSVEDFHQPSHLVKMSSKDIKRKSKKKSDNISFSTGPGLVFASTI